MKGKLMLLFSVLVFYKVAVILQYFTQLETGYTFQSEGIKNPRLKYILYWNEAYKNKGEYDTRKNRKIEISKLLPKIMDSAAVLSLLGNTNALSVTVFLPTTGQFIRRENKIMNAELSSGLCFPRWKIGTLSGLVADLSQKIQFSEICQDLGLVLSDYLMLKIILLDQPDKDTSSGRLSPPRTFTPSILTTTNTSSTGPSASDRTPLWSCPTEVSSKRGIILRGRNSTSWSGSLVRKILAWLREKLPRRTQRLRWPGWSPTASLRATERASWRILRSISTLISMAIVIKVRIEQLREWSSPNNLLH